VQVSILFSKVDTRTRAILKIFVFGLLFFFSISSQKTRVLNLLPMRVYKTLIIRKTRNNQTENVLKNHWKKCSRCNDIRKSRLLCIQLNLKRDGNFRRSFHVTFGFANNYSRTCICLCIRFVWIRWFIVALSNV